VETVQWRATPLPEPTETPSRWAFHLLLAQGQLEWQFSECTAEGCNLTVGPDDSGVGVIKVAKTKIKSSEVVLESFVSASSSL
jgi:hypothetical protein